MAKFLAFMYRADKPGWHLQPLPDNENGVNGSGV